MARNVPPIQGGRPPYFLSASIERSENGQHVNSGKAELMEFFDGAADQQGGWDQRKRTDGSAANGPLSGSGEVGIPDHARPSGNAGMGKQGDATSPRLTSVSQNPICLTATNMGGIQTRLSDGEVVSPHEVITKDTAVNQCGENHCGVWVCGAAEKPSPITREIGPLDHARPSGTAGRGTPSYATSSRQILVSPKPSCLTATGGNKTKIAGDDPEQKGEAEANMHPL